MNQSDNSSNILVMEAFEHVHPDHCDKYEAAALFIDNLVKESEPGMLVHALTKMNKSPELVTYRWLEVFSDSNALRTHLDNPAVIEHVAKLNSGILAAPTELVLYTSWSDEEKNDWRRKLNSTKLTFAPVIAGFYLKR
ncbi:putative quinol monooxygenase [Roseibium sediminicola]|uniref:Quinol monooxygenase YgiN n=1 Tax=Roseibium sediminicola TaxID=2933272 RepID=A0ABT0GZZ1_9HYPH|nr:hypothetical protein [Roseibium sp. CAU 1639]MCK7614999.1 hypothetical protein [Roseibium sp. CAU 1639]